MSSDEGISEPVAVGGNESGGWVRKVDRQDECACVRDLAQKAPARLRRLHGISVKDGRPIGFPALERVMHHVAGDDRLLAL
jgi:hypothetical protein